MDLKIALLVGLAVGLIAAAIWLWPSPSPILVPAAQISVEDATAQWAIGLKGNGSLDQDTSVVLPRIQIGYAATSKLVSPLQPSTELGKDTKHAVQRILVEHVATAAIVSMVGSKAPTLSTAPRILVEHAATTLPIGPLRSSSELQSDGVQVLTKLLIENAEVVETKLLEAMPPDSPGE